MRRVFRRLGANVRVRVTGTAMLAVVAALVASAVVINVSLTHDRQKILQDTANSDAKEVLALNPDLASPIRLPAYSSINAGLEQVLRDNQVVAASRGLKQLPPLWYPGDPLVQPAQDEVSGLAKDVQIVMVPETANRVEVNVVVVISMAQFEHTVADVRQLLELGIPILLLVVGSICWLIVGRALRPIERMRREVAGVATGSGGIDLHRVAEPAHNDEVGRLARTLNSMLDRMEASTVRERRFVSDASHELRTPIANIRTELEVALRHPDIAEWPVVAGEVLDQNGRMERLVAGLLLLARSDEGSLIEAPEPSDLAVVVESVVGELGVEAVRPGSHTFATHPAVTDSVRPEPVIRVRTRPSFTRVPVVYAERLVTNLVDNARRFALSRVDVDVSTAMTGNRGRVVLTVSDDGPGVPLEDRQRIFERFVRLDPARHRGEGGFGLGLAIVADLALFYGGSIRVDDSEMGGARFVLELPAVAAGAPSPVPTPVRPDPVPSA